MQLHGMKTVSAFIAKHISARAALNRWVAMIKNSEMNNHAELKSLFGSADYVQNRKAYVFNVGGNKFRVIAKVRFDKQTVKVEEVMTHAEYNNW